MTDLGFVVLRPLFEAFIRGARCVFTDPFTDPLPGRLEKGQFGRKGTPPQLDNRLPAADYATWSQCFALEQAPRQGRRTTRPAP